MGNFILNLFMNTLLCLVILVFISLWVAPLALALYFFNGWFLLFYIIIIALTMTLKEWANDEFWF